MTATETIRMSLVGTQRYLVASRETDVADIRDLIDSKFETQPPWEEFGVAPGGFVLHNKTLETHVEIHRHDHSLHMKAHALVRGTFALAAVSKDANDVLHALVWPRVKLIHVNDPWTVGQGSENVRWRVAFLVMSDPVQI